MAKGIKLRNWSLDARDFETDDQFRAAVELELARFEHIGERFGIALVAAPIKHQVGGDYVTVGWSFQTATVPAVREQPVEPEDDVVSVSIKPMPDEVVESVEEAAASVVADDPYAEDE